MSRFVKHAGNGCQHAGIVSRTKVDTYRVFGRYSQRLDVIFQTFDIFDRHGRYLFDHICYSFDDIAKSHNSDTFFQRPSYRMTFQYIQYLGLLEKKVIERMLWKAYNIKILVTE